VSQQRSISIVKPDAVAINTAHGADGQNTVKAEMAFFFSDDELYPCTHGYVNVVLVN